MNLRFRLLPIFLLPLLAACNSDKQTDVDQAEPGQAIVATTFYPTTYFSERIAGDLVKVKCPLPADADPIFWQPENASIQFFQKADLIVLNGAGFEKWVEVVSLPEAKVVDTALPFKDQWVKYKQIATHTHGPGGDEHAHEGLDGHTWLDPILAAEQAKAIFEAMAKRWPEHTEALTKNHEALRSDLAELDIAWKAIKPPAKLYASHPAYNYLAKRYGWSINNLDLDPEAIPDPLPKLPADATLLWESTPTDAVREALGLKQQVTISPCETEEPGLDYLQRMQANIEALLQFSNL